MSTLLDFLTILVCVCLGVSFGVVPLCLLIGWAWERRTGRPVDQMLLTPAERPARVVQVGHSRPSHSERRLAAIVDRDLASKRAAFADQLNEIFALPEAPNPKLLYSSGDIERSLMAQRERDRERGW